LFETMIFGGEHDQYQVRYSTWDDALNGHQFAVNLAQGVDNPPYEENAKLDEAIDDHEPEPYSGE